MIDVHRTSRLSLSTNRVSFSHLCLAKSAEDLDSYVGQDGDMDIACLVVSRYPEDVYERAMARASDLVETPDLEVHIASLEKPPRVVVSGFPTTPSEVGIDEFAVKLAYAKLLGTYAGPGRYPHTHKLAVTDRGIIRDPNGMSGSPVYVKVPPPPHSRRNPYILIGMVVIGKKDADLEYVTQRPLVNLARDAIARLKDA